MIWIYKLRRWVMDIRIARAERRMPKEALSAGMRALNLPETYGPYDFTAWRQLLKAYRDGDAHFIFRLARAAAAIGTYRGAVALAGVEAPLVLEFFFPHGSVFLIFGRSIDYRTTMRAAIDDVGDVIEELLEAGGQ
jgi:hypothetical protein